MSYYFVARNIGMILGLRGTQIMQYVVVEHYKINPRPLRHVHCRERQGKTLAATMLVPFSAPSPLSDRGRAFSPLPARWWQRGPSWTVGAWRWALGAAAWLLGGGMLDSQSWRARGDGRRCR